MNNRRTPPNKYARCPAILPYLSHSARISVSVSLSKLQTSMMPCRTITGLAAIDCLSRERRADIWGLIISSKVIEDWATTQLVSVVFLIVKGVVIPWLLFPRPSPTLNPYFCIIFKAFSSASDNYGWCYSYAADYAAGGRYNSSGFPAYGTESYSKLQRCLHSQKQLGKAGSYSSTTIFLTSMGLGGSTALAFSIKSFLDLIMLASFQFMLVMLAFFFSTCPPS